MQMGFRLQEIVWTFSTKPREELFDDTVKTLKEMYDHTSPRPRPTQSRFSSRQPSPISLSQTPAAPHDEPNYREVSRPKNYTPPTEPVNQGMGMRPLPIRPANPGNSEANANPGKYGEKSDTATDALDRLTWKVGGRYKIATINPTDSVRFAKAADSLTKFYAANPSRMYSGGPDESFDGCFRTFQREAAYAGIMDDKDAAMLMSKCLKGAALAYFDQTMTSNGNDLHRVCCAIRA